MKVRVKKDQKGFIYGSLRREGAEFTLKSYDHPKKLDDKGKPLVVSIDSQFSSIWMEKLDQPKAKPGRKPKAKPEVNEQSIQTE